MAASLTSARRPLLRSLATAALLIVGSGALVACGSATGERGMGSGTDSYVGPESAPAPGAPDSRPSDSGNGSKDSSYGGGPTAGSAPVSILTGNRDLIRTGQLDVKVVDLSNAAARARAYIVTVGGQISSENSVLAVDPGIDRHYPGPIPGSFVQMVIALPPTTLDASMDALAQLGELTSRAQSIEDVTLQVVDLQSRTTSMRASIERVRALMDRATSIADVVALESELSRREADLESMTGQLQILQSQSAVSTLVLTLNALSATGPVDKDRGGPLAALRNSIRALGDGAAAVITGLAAALPFLALVALVGGAGWLIVRPRRRAAAAQPAASEAPPAAQDPAPADD